MQVGVGHSFSLGATGWKWKLTSCLGGDNVSRIRNKTSVGLCDGVDLRFGWRADYVLPEISGWVLNLLHYTLDECKSCFTQLSTVSYCCGGLCKKCCYFDIVWELRDDFSLPTSEFITLTVREYISKFQCSSHTEECRYQYRECENHLPRALLWLAVNLLLY